MWMKFVKTMFFLYETRISITCNNLNICRINRECIVLHFSDITSELLKQSWNIYIDQSANQCKWYITKMHQHIHPVDLTHVLVIYRYTSKYLWEKKEEIWLSPMTKAPTATEKSRKQRDNTKTPPKTSITQWLRTDLGRSVGVTTVTPLVSLNWFISAEPSH